MARQGISEDQVFAAAHELREEGMTPTVQAVRERIGSGSFSTINAHLGAWKAQNAAQAVAAIPAIPEKVQGAFAQIWATAARGAQEGFETQREALEATRREMERERASMAEEIERLEKELEAQAGLQEKTGAERDAERAARIEADKQVTALTVENARLEERAGAAERWAGELKAQFEGLQEKLAEAVKQAATPRPARKKSPAPKPGES